MLIAIATTDFLFALDSIPAVYGVTQHPYIVLAANVFALLGLRALYFLVSGLLDRLVYLSTGLAVILVFIGVKLVLHFAHLHHALGPRDLDRSLARGDRGRARGHHDREPRPRASGRHAHAGRCIHARTPCAPPGFAGDPGGDAPQGTRFPMLGSPRQMRRSSRGRLVALPAAVATFAVLGGPPDPEHALRTAGSTLGPWTYGLVGVMAFLETGAGIGLIAPGELAVILGGVAAGQGQVELVPLIALVWVCAVAGDRCPTCSAAGSAAASCSSTATASSSRPERLEQVERYFARHGGKTILFGRFIGWVRALAPFIAGASRMPARRFVPATIAAAGLWAVACTLLGYVFWNSLDHAVDLAQQGSLAIAAVVALGAAGTYAFKRWRRRMAAEPGASGAAALGALGACRVGSPDDAYERAVAPGGATGRPAEAVRLGVRGGAGARAGATASSSSSSSTCRSIRRCAAG